jgi:hypothetical protein
MLGDKVGSARPFARRRDGAVEQSTTLVESRIHVIFGIVIQHQARVSLVGSDVYWQ